MVNTLAVEVTKEDYDRWQGQALTLLHAANALEVVDAESEQLAGAFVDRLNDEIKDVVETFAKPKAKAHEAHRAMCDAEKLHVGERKRAKRIATGKIGEYQTKQERQRREEQERRQREAQKQADEEALRRAEALEADGRHTEAEAVVNAPVVAPVMSAPPPPSKPVGAQTREHWQFEIVNPLLVPRQFCVPDHKGIGAYARSTKKAAKMDGVRFYLERY